MTQPLLILAFVLLSGCTHLGADTDDCEGLTSRLGALYERIDAEVGDPRADDIAACRAVAFGVKPCGGPATYLIFSTTESDTAEIERLVTQYNELDERRNTACGLGSTCDLTPEPILILNEGRCASARAVY